MKATHLQVEYLTKPLGLYNPRPRFFWNCEGGIKQTAYRIICKRGNETIWDSKIVKSSSMTHIFYDGTPLKSRDIVFYSVQLWDENNQSGEISESFFELGLLNQNDWTSKWISGNYKPLKNHRYPADYFKKNFLAKGKIIKARLYATARGVYNVKINDTMLYNYILAPGITDYRKRIHYQTYDVTKLLKESNTIEIKLGDGWYRGSIAAYGVTNVFGKNTSIIAQLEITYEDGSTSSIITDDSWSWSNDGQIRFNDLKDGEIIDASMQASYNNRAIEVSLPKDVMLVASDNVPVSEHECFKPKMIVSQDGKRVLDFCQNIAGYLEFVVKGLKGQSFKLICGEVLDNNGHVDLSGVQETRPEKEWTQLGLIKKLITGKVGGKTQFTPKQEIIFSCSGKEDRYKSSFCIFGFRYVQIEGDIEINLDDFSAIAVYSDMEQTGDFNCSDEQVNKLLNNTRWSMKSNFLDIPTDCPTRERLGWTGDAQIFFDTGSYLMNTAPFFAKWLKDMKDAQYKEGFIPAVLPYNGVEMMYKNSGASVGWSDAIYLVPYRYYKRYGDVEILRQYWPMMKKYVDYIESNLGHKDKKEAKSNPDNEFTYEKGLHLGEWLEPKEFQEKISATNRPKRTEEATAYYHLTLITMAKIASILGEEKYEKKWMETAIGVKRAYKRFAEFNTNRQAKLVRPLALGLLDDEDKTRAQKQLVKAVENYDFRVGTGFLSTPFLLPVLTEANEIETAYKLLLNNKNPGWLFEIKQGATTIWESWEGDASRNHYSPGSVCQWLFDTVIGIRIDKENQFIISPIPGKMLSYAKGYYNSIYGTVKSCWEKLDDAMKFIITIPSNTSAVICLPNGETHKVSAGKYEFII